MKLESSAFKNDGVIPEKYAHQRENVSPPLTWSGVPRGAKSLALIVDDPDAPSGTFVHWLVWDISPETTGLAEGAGSGKLAGGARQGRNGFGEVGYDGPQPPSGTHRYYFRLYALDSKIDEAAGATRAQLDRAMRGHVMEKCELMGKYSHR
ncbi:MAG TPA: YbhB/YbcL family Raf kinase inhibitor-like protein [Bryobacteraceae bacterium]|nr:YbhB/YbcL family Raf kinase inhibitor-like protein [Bryobacteraceae bacterium]